MTELTPVEIMVATGVKWLREDRSRDPQFSTNTAMPGALFTENADADMLNFVIVEAAENAGHPVSESMTNGAILQIVEAKIQMSPERNSQ